MKKGQFDNCQKVLCLWCFSRLTCGKFGVNFYWVDVWLHRFQSDKNNQPMRSEFSLRSCPICALSPNRSMPRMSCLDPFKVADTRLRKCDLLLCVCSLQTLSNLVKCYQIILSVFRRPGVAGLKTLSPLYHCFITERQAAPGFLPRRAVWYNKNRKAARLENKSGNSD